MKSIKKIKESSKAVAGTALLVGATLAGGAAFATAQNSGSSGDLGDYPAPFVDDEGAIASTIVMGEDAKATDVVAAADIAGQLGNDAFSTEEVSTGSGAVGTWTADNGVTLNRQNSNLFLNDASDAEETRLDESDLNVLETTTFDSEDNEEVEVETEVQVGSQNQNFNSGVGDIDDPVLHVQNPTNPTSGDNLFSATVEFSETIDFTAAPDNFDSLTAGADEAIEDGDEIEMFGTTYTFSDESTSSELVLYGSSDRVEVATGDDATTVTVEGNEVSLATQFVSENGNDATVTVDGSTESVQEGDTVGPAGNVRVSDIYRTGPDGQGRVAFSQGSDELKLDAGNGDVEVDGEILDGVEVSVPGGNFATADGIDFYFGALDGDEDYVAAGENYEDPLFGMEFHYGGLSGDTAEDPAEAVEVDANEDGTASITVSDPTGDSSDVTFVDNDDNGLNPTPIEVTSDSGEYVATFEGEVLSEDDRVILNSNEEAGLYEITGLTEDLASADTGNGDVSVTLRNVVTGDSTTVDEDDIDVGDSEYDDVDGTDDGNDVYTLDSESIEGMDFDVTFYRGDDEVSFERTAKDSDVQVFPSLYTESDSVVTFTEDQEATSTSFATVEADLSGTDGDDSYTVDIELPSTVSSSDNVVTLDVNDGTGADQLAASIAGESTSLDTSTSGNTGEVEFMAGQTVYQLTLQAQNATTEGTDGSAGTASVSHHMAVDQDQSVDGSPNGALGPSAFVLQPEDDEDEEFGYFFEPDVSENAGDLNVVYTGGAAQNGATGPISENSWITADMDSEDNVEVGYNDYGAYTMFDTDNSDEDVFNLHLPAAQSTAGMAVTGADGDLSADGSSGGMVETMSPTGWSSGYVALDSDNTVSSAKQDSNLILVGGPAANSLVQELVDANKTMPTSDYTEGQGMVQLVPEAFNEDHDALVVAGYSGEDTRQAGEFLTNYEQNSDALEGSSEVTINTAEGTVVQ